MLIILFIFLSGNLFFSSIQIWSQSQRPDDGLFSNIYCISTVCFRSLELLLYCARAAMPPNCRLYYYIITLYTCTYCKRKYVSNTEHDLGMAVCQPGTSHLQADVYQPQSNGLTEHFHRRLKDGTRISAAESTYIAGIFICRRRYWAPTCF